MTNKISIARTAKNPDFDQIFAAVKRAIDLAGGIRSIVKLGQKVLVSGLRWVAGASRRK